MSTRQDSSEFLAIRLTLAERLLLTLLSPNVPDALDLRDRKERDVGFTRGELRAIQKDVAAELQQASGTERTTLRHLLRKVTDLPRVSPALRQAGPKGVYQFKITLAESKPPIWRRIQVKDCTLDKLHEHIQTAMGWTNSHLHHFIINDLLLGDPLLMEEDFEELGYLDSTRTKLSRLLARVSKGFRFEYKYDFGDNWDHDMYFEGIVPAERGMRYPRCVAGKRACPPEDVGGIWGYADFVAAVTNRRHKRHRELLAWSGPFDPEAFDVDLATRSMHRGLPDWRQWI